MDKELIDHIKTQLNNHEESYSPGAWERFSVQEKGKKRGFIYWPLWSAAALILVFGGLFLSLYKTEKINPVVVSKPVIEKVKPAAPVSGQATVATMDTENNPSENNIALKNTLSNQPKNTETNSQSAQVTPLIENTAVPESNHELAVLNPNQLENRLVSVSILNAQKQRNFEIITEKKKTPVKNSFEELLAKDTFLAQQKGKTKLSKEENKWQPGVYIAPAMGNDNKVNMNYGFSLSYSLADKLSLSSGISYAALSSTSDPVQNKRNMGVADAPASNLFASTDNSSRSLQSIDASVRGINIPLELKYKISDKFYTGVGISALAILNNKQQNNYVVTQAQNTTVVNAMGFSEQKMLVVSERVSEPQSESVTAPEKYLGFYNFSLGYKQKISAKKNIAVEPFLRLPMKNFSKDNLNLTNGGLRLKIDF
ncbi:hypothetical protein [Pedobacter punctiformis]|uniref:Outer membrane protein beta-barrel domain-containing protein n=1 Tax=Pedobacter punctiformis TaxID=3004097 RepID=A0ABT4LAX8_9SPHI|nr:hypothetical protein [Pedobacter sp. HCMS5-2]MCZ4245021.1 hypothetical protein [Pedobacter sp. HCMS5-2]